jgi:FMN reductase
MTPSFADRGATVGRLTQSTEEESMSERRIVVVSAGLSQPSSTRLLGDRLADATSTALAERGETVTVRTIELRDLAHDVINAMLTGFSTGTLAEAIEAVTGADGLVLVTPLFTTTYSGLFKSFVDILDKDSLGGMPVVLGATGGSPRHSLALEYSMRPLLTYLKAEVATTTVFAATDDWAGSGDGAALPERIGRAGRELADIVVRRPARSRGQTDTDQPYAGTASFEDLLGEIAG